MDLTRHSSRRSEPAGLLNCPRPSAHSARLAVQLVAPPYLNQSAPPSADEWPIQIQRVWVQGTTNILKLARIVSRARRAMDFGAWTRMWRSKQLPFAVSKAKILVRVGERLGDLNGQTFGRLPSGWSILYQLARLDRTTLERLIQEGVIHPGLTEREARRLVAQFRGETLKTRSARAILRERLRRFAEFVAINFAHWKAEERELARDGLTRLIQLVGNPGGIEQGDDSLRCLPQCHDLTD